MAQRQGPSAQAARSTRDAARYRDRAFNSRLLPQLFLSGNAANLNHGINPITQPDGSTQFLGQSQNQSSLRPCGSARRFRSPAARSPSARRSAASTSSATRPAGSTGRRRRSSSALQQDLFKPRTLVWDERVQSLSASVAERQYLEAREDVAGNTADAFFDLYRAQMTLANATANAAVNDTLYTLNKGRYEVGKIGENELLKSELALLRARAAVDDARLARDRAEAALRRNDRLSRRASRSRSSRRIPFPIVDADPDVAVKQALKNSSVMEHGALDDAVDAAADHRGEAQQPVQRLDSRDASDSTRPRPCFGQAYQSPLGKQSLQVGVNMPMIQWGAGRADVEAAQRRRSAA